MPKLRLNLTRRDADRTPMDMDNLGDEENSDVTASAAAAGLQIGTPEQFRWLYGIIKAVLLLNLLDATFTLLWVRSGLATEANTLLDELVNDNALGFIAIKLSLVAMGSWLLWQQRQHAAAVVGIFTVFLVYYGLLLFHLQYASTLVRHFLDTN